MRIIFVYFLLFISVCATAQTSSPDDDYRTGAYYYEKGDYKNAFRYFLSAAKAGDSNAQNDIGNMYQTGEGVIQSYTNAFQWYLKAANQGHYFAQNSLGDLYYSGNGVKQDYLKAYEWYSKAAELGCNEAQFSLGSMYHYGDGVKQDYLKAYEWYSKAAEQDNTNAQYALGVLYDDGYGVLQDHMKAYEWYMKAAQSGDWMPLYCLGRLFLNGLGVKEDLNKAELWFKKSIEANKNNPYSYGRLGLIYALRDKDYKKALEYSDLALSCKEIKNGDKAQIGKIYGARGQIFYLKGDMQNAKKVLNKCIELNPKYLDSDDDFAKIMSKQNNRGSYSYDNKVHASSFVDIDSDIFINPIINNYHFAIIIGNEKYKNEVDVPFANNDSKIFCQYVEKTLGVPHEQIRLIENAGYNDIRIAINWLVQAMRVCRGKGKAIIYYAGHGIPNESDQSSYLLPVDGIGNDPGSAYALQELYDKLENVDAKSITIFLDACFSGSKREEGMLTSARGVAIKAKQSTPKGNLIIFSAAQGDETAYPYKDKQHGLFTYFLLKKLQETKGEVTLGELSEYLADEVGRQSFIKNNKIQTPTVSVSSSLQNSWKSIKLK